MIKKLLHISNKLDEVGLHKEADFMDAIIKAAGKKKKYTKKQLKHFDGDGDGKPFEPEDFKKLRNDAKDSKKKKTKKKKKDDDVQICTECGYENSSTANFCQNCGTKL